jgi:hypothetical protein
MIRRIATAALLLALLPSLISAAPVPLGSGSHPPRTTAVHVTKQRHIVTRPAVRAHAQHACSYETAPFRLGPQQVVDPIDYPYGEVIAWSCVDAQTAIAEFNARLTAMQAQAAAYRAAHPVP